MRKNKLVLLFVCAILMAGSSPAQAQRHAVNELAVDFPTDGGGFLSYSRLWSFNKYTQGGFIVGGGVIKRKFDLNVAGATDFDVETEATVFPFFGPRLTFLFNVIGVSLSYGIFYAKTDVEARRQNSEVLSGDVSGWGTGFYSPLISIDFYSDKYNLVFGFGLGGLLGASYPDLEAHSSTTRLVTDESPIDTLTIHTRMRWSTDWKRKKRKVEFDDEF